VVSGIYCSPWADRPVGARWRRAGRRSATMCLERPGYGAVGHALRGDAFQKIMRVPRVGAFGCIGPPGARPDGWCVRPPSWIDRMRSGRQQAVQIAQRGVRNRRISVDGLPNCLPDALPPSQGEPNIEGSNPAGAKSNKQKNHLKHNNRHRYLQNDVRRSPRHPEPPARCCLNRSFAASSLEWLLVMWRVSM
jgi:hypothetical protein